MPMRRPVHEVVSVDDFGGPREHGVGDRSGGYDEAVSELLKPADHAGLVQKFRAGETKIRDIADFTGAEWVDMMNMGRRLLASGAEVGTDSMSTEELQLVSNRASSFTNNILLNRQPGVQTSAAKNMFTEMKRTYIGRRDYSGVSARLLNERMREVHGKSLAEVVGSRYSEQAASQLWVQLTHEFPVETMWYLAERLAPAHEYQKSQYGHHLERAKSQIGAMLPHLELPASTLREVEEKLRLTSFSAFDHAKSGVTFHDGNSYGDYTPGTLRIEAKSDGSPRDPRTPSPTRVFEAIQHELMHALEAQHLTEDGRATRGGLKFLSDHATMMKFNEPNEALTEFLNQLAQGKVQQRGGRTVATGDARGYNSIVPKIGMLHDTDRRAFTALVHTYFGSTEVNPAHLKRAFELYFS